MPDFQPWRLGFGQLCLSKCWHWPVLLENNSDLTILFVAY
jgi:hypothetical protein